MNDGDLSDLLAPLARVESVRRNDANRRRGRRLLPLALVAAITLAGSAATYQAYRSTMPSEARATRSALPRAVSCLIGGRAGQASRVLRREGYVVSWRFETYQASGIGYAATPEAVSSSDVVEDIVASRNKVMIVFVRAPHAAHAPPIQSTCAGTP
jgi:hypothetical protein